MSNPIVSTSGSPESPAVDESNESFKDILSQFEQSKSRKPDEAAKGREGTVIAVTADSVLVDIGFKTEGILPLAAFPGAGEKVKAGDKLLVSIKGRDPEGYYQLTLGKIERPKDWAALQKAFAEKTTIMGTVTAVVKGGLSVDVGVRAFMPASRSGARDAAEMEKLVEQEIRCRITKLDETEEDVVVDRRIVLEEEERAAKGAATPRSRRATRCTAPFAASLITVLSSISAGWTRYCMSATSPEAASASRQMSSRQGKRSKSRFSRLTRKNSAFLWA